MPAVLNLVQIQCHGHVFALVFWTDICAGPIIAQGLISTVAI